MLSIREPRRQSPEWNVLSVTWLVSETVTDTETCVS